MRSATATQFHSGLDLSPVCLVNSLYHMPLSHLFEETLLISMRWAKSMAPCTCASVRMPLPSARSPQVAPTLIASVKKTGRLLVVHEAPLIRGFHGEIAA